MCYVFLYLFYFACSSCSLSLSSYFYFTLIRYKSICFCLSSLFCDFTTLIVNQPSPVYSVDQLIYVWLYLSKNLRDRKGELKKEGWGLYVCHLVRRVPFWQRELWECNFAVRWSRWSLGLSCQTSWQQRWDQRRDHPSPVKNIPVWLFDSTAELVSQSRSRDLGPFTSPAALNVSPQDNQHSFTDEGPTF